MKKKSIKCKLKKSACASLIYTPPFPDRTRILCLIAFILISMNFWSSSMPPKSNKKSQIDSLKGVQQTLSIKMLRYNSSTMKRLNNMRIFYVH